MKVLFIISTFSPVVGGAQRQALLLARTLRQQGAGVEVLTRYWPGLKREDSIQGVPVHRTGVPLEGKLGSVLGAFFWMIYVLRHGRRYQVFHAHQPFSALWAALLGKLLWRGQVIVKIPGTATVRFFETRWLKRVVTRRYVDAVVTVNHENQEELIRLGFPPSQIFMIANGVDVAAFRPHSNVHRNQGERSVVSVGRLVPTKGVDMLLESWKAIEGNGMPVSELCIVGDGPERNRLEAQAAALGLKHVRFTGMVSDIHPYLEGATVYVTPSKVEGLSNALLEAMAAGLPIVATEIEGTREVLRDGENGLLVEPGSCHALTLALLRLLGDSALRERLGCAARDTVAQAYSIEAIARQYLRLYKVPA